MATILTRAKEIEYSETLSPPLHRHHRTNTISTHSIIFIPVVSHPDQNLPWSIDPLILMIAAHPDSIQFPLTRVGISIPGPNVASSPSPSNTVSFLQFPEHCLHAYPNLSLSLFF
jgi:hypothetical protein